MKLVVVESSQKADRFRLVLGKAQRILVAPPPLRGLEPDGLVVGEDGEVAERYTLLPEREPLVAEFRQLAAEARQVLLATAPGRAGEALAWDLLNCLPEEDQVKVKRLALAQLDEHSLRQALEAPGDLNPRLVDAWRARRVSDLLAHEAVAPQLRRWKLGGETPPAITLAGMAALRLVVEREWQRHTRGERRWTVDAELARDGLGLWAEMTGDPGITCEAEARALVDLLQEPETSWHVETLEAHEVAEPPAAPFTTATLLQAAAQDLNFTPGQAMQAARDLYDRGLVTDPCTAASQIGPAAARSAQRMVRALYGREFLPAGPEDEADGGGAEEEAIRPTSLMLHPDLLVLHALYDLVISEESRALYNLIWRRTVAAQMPPARERVVLAGIRPLWTGSVEPWEEPGRYPHPFTFRAELRQTLAEGCRRVYRETGRAEDVIRSAVLLDVLDKGDELQLRQVRAAEVGGGLPARYTAGELIAELAGRGIGHPETYAALVEGLVEQGYARLEAGELSPTPLGEDVLYVCIQHLPEVFRLETAAEMEGRLAQVAQGTLSRREALEAFAARLSPDTPQPAAQDPESPTRIEEVAA